VTALFVGRKDELAGLAADLDAALAGSGGVVLLGGEPGIGKTRLAEELAAQATACGVLVLWGRCWEGEGAPAFWPWIQVVRAYVETGRRPRSSPTRWSDCAGSSSPTSASPGGASRAPGGRALAVSRRPPRG
jgi:predicted ATPase